jgi:hypothetical protein
MKGRYDDNRGADQHEPVNQKNRQPRRRATASLMESGYLTNQQTLLVMKTHPIIALASAALLFSACIPSVKPFYTDQDVAFDPRLLGEWREKDKADDPTVWRFERAGDQSYKLTVIEEQKKEGKFSARLFKLKAEWFLDLIPTDCDYATNQADLVAFSIVPGHLLVHVSQIEPELKLAFFDFDWLQKHLEKNPQALAHHRENDRIVLTAETRDLQSFVLQHLGAGELFDQPGAMVRKPNSATQ